MTRIQTYVFSLQLQLSLYTYLSAEFIGTATIYNTIRRVGTVLQLMYMLKYYYWAVIPADSSGITPKGLGKHIAYVMSVQVLLGGLWEGNNFFVN